eukprot:scaffold12190_cov25-Attheya_sp.AAC.1
MGMKDIAADKLKYATRRPTHTKTAKQGVTTKFFVRLVCMEFLRSRLREMSFSQNVMSCHAADNNNIMSTYDRLRSRSDLDNEDAAPARLVDRRTNATWRHKTQWLKRIHHESEPLENLKMCGTFLAQNVVSLCGCPLEETVYSNAIIMKHARTMTDAGYITYMWYRSGWNRADDEP